MGVDGRAVINQSFESCCNLCQIMLDFYQESTHDRSGSLPRRWTGTPEYIGREVALMTAYEIISIFIGIVALLMSFGSLLVALLAFLDKRNRKRKK